MLPPNQSNKRWQRKLRVANKTVCKPRANLPPRCDHLFDPWLTLPSGATVRCIERLLEPVIFASKAGRQRALRQDSKKHRRAILKAIVANFVYANLAHDGWVAIPLGTAHRKLTRYGREGFNQLPQIIKRLHDAGLLRLHKSKTKGYASIIEPRADLANVIEASTSDITLRDCTIDHHKDTVSLGIAEVRQGTGKPIRIRQKLNYKDTAAAKRFRREMKQINAALASANLSLDGSEDVRTSNDHDDTITRLIPHDRFDTDSGVSRRMHRTFSVPTWFNKTMVETFKKHGSLHLGGRLFGGWWLNLAKTERHRIRIDGEPVADLDFNAMFVRLAYVMLRPPSEGHLPRSLTAPDGDPYRLPGFEAHRKGVKTVFLAMFSRPEPLKQLPQGTVALLPRGTTIQTITAAILKEHPALDQVFEFGACHAQMFAESQIMVAVLLRLNDLGITALPMHDGLMVATSKAEAAKAEMEKIARTYAGFTMPVSLELMSERAKSPESVLS